MGDRPLRLANLCHMWELYARWTRLGVFLAERLGRSGAADHRTAAELITFTAICMGRGNLRRPLGTHARHHAAMARLRASWDAAMRFAGRG